MAVEKISALTHRRGPGRDSWRGVIAAQWDGTGRPGRGGDR
jgi:hypothetical protein